MLNASIVLYHHTISEITPLINSLIGSGVVSELFLVDNSPEPLSFDKNLPVTYIFNNCNLGYGAAHNIAIRRSLENNIPYHLVVNPDIHLETEILGKLIDYMNKNADIGQIIPKVLYPNGKIQYICKLLPTPGDLIFRRFLPTKWTRKAREKFELHDSGYDQIMDVPYLSGCFMLLRTRALEQVGLFDERFFMYPEDIDLTRRMHRHFRTVFYPEVSIIHRHEQGSYISPKLLWIHIVNMIRYFNKWGWFFDKERREINKKIICKLSVK